MNSSPQSETPNQLSKIPEQDLQKSNKSLQIDAVLAVKSAGEIALSTSSKMVRTLLLKKFGFSREDILLPISRALDACVSSFKIANRPTPYEVTAIAEQVMDDYCTYKLEDFVKCFDMASKGFLGDLDFNRIDKSVIYGWLTKYDILRDNEIMKLRTAQKKAIVWDFTVANPVASSEFGKLAEKIGKMEPKKEEESTPLENPCEPWYKEFDDLYASQEDIRKRDRSRNTGIRAVLYNGNYYTQDQFINMKIEEKINF